MHAMCTIIWKYTWTLWKFQSKVLPSQCFPQDPFLQPSPLLRKPQPNQRVLWRAPDLLVHTPVTSKQWTTSLKVTRDTFEFSLWSPQAKPMRKSDWLVETIWSQLTNQICALTSPWLRRHNSKVPHMNWWRFMCKYTGRFLDSIADNCLQVAGLYFKEHCQGL